MNRNEWVSRLWRYRSDQARKEYLRGYIPLMEQKLEYLREDAYASIGARRWMPGGRPSGPGDPTALLAARAAEDALSPEMRACRDQLRKLRREYTELNVWLSMTECMLASLDEESRFLLTARYIDHTRWMTLPDAYHQQFHEYYSENTLRRRLYRALDTLCDAGRSGE